MAIPLYGPLAGGVLAAGLEASVLRGAVGRAIRMVDLRAVDLFDGEGLLSDRWTITNGSSFDALNETTFPGRLFHDHGSVNAADTMHRVIHVSGDFDLRLLIDNFYTPASSQAIAMYLYKNDGSGDPDTTDFAAIKMKRRSNGAAGFRRFMRVANSTTLDIEESAVWGFPAQLKLKRVGNNFTIGYKNEGDAAFTESTTANANIGNDGVINLRFELGSTDSAICTYRWLKDFNIVAFSTSAPVATSPIILGTGVLDPSVAEFVILQIDDDGIIRPENYQVLPDTTDRLKIGFSVDGGSFSAFETAASYKARVNPITYGTGIQHRWQFNSDGTQQILLMPSRLGELAAVDLPDVGNVTEDDTVDGVQGTYRETVESDVAAGVLYGEDAVEKEGTLDSSKGFNPGFERLD